MKKRRSKGTLSSCFRELRISGSYRTWPLGRYSMSVSCWRYHRKLQTMLMMKNIQIHLEYSAQKSFLQILLTFQYECVCSDIDGTVVSNDGVDVRQRKVQVFEVKDDKKMDFFYVIKGEVRMVFEVERVFDLSANQDETVVELTQDEVETRKDVEQIQKLPARVRDMLIEPYFQTEVQVENAIRQAESVDIRELGESYLKDPKGTEESLFYVNSTAKQHQVISDHSIDKLRPDYQKFYTKVFDYIRSKIHNYPNVKYPRKIKRFDDKLIRIETVDPKSFLIRLPYQKMVKIMNSFWRDYNSFAEFLYTYVPLLTNYTLKQKQKIMSCFHEEQFSPLQPIMRERTIPDQLYIVVSGQVRLVTSFNPFTQKFNKANKCEDSTDQILLKNANGLGNISKTVSENNIGLMQSGQWFGEEIALMKVPLIYSAIATTDVKLLKVSIEDFQAKFPSEIHSILENKCYEKLDWIRSRLEKCHLLRKEISSMNQISKTYEKTISHVRGIYPTSTLPAQINIRKALMNESSNNPNLLLFTQNKRIEKLRVLEEERTGKQTFKSYIVEQERERALKEKLSESLKQMVSAQMSRSKVQSNREGGLSVMQNYNIAGRKQGGGGTQSILRNIYANTKQPRFTQIQMVQFLSQYGLDNPLQVRGESTMRINLSLLRGNISNSVIDTDRKRLGLNVKLPQSVAGDNLLEAAETSVDTKSILSQQFQVRTNLSMPQSYRNGDVIPEMPTGSEDTMGGAAAYLSSKMEGSDQQSQEIIKVTEQSSSLPMLVQNHHAQSINLQEHLGESNNLEQVSFSEVHKQDI